MKSIWLTSILFLQQYAAQSQFSIIHYDTSNSGLPSNFINSITFDKDDNIWFGAGSEGTGGIIRFDGNEWNVVEIEDTNNIGLNDITEILFAYNADMWMYSYSNQGCHITKWDGSGFSDFTPQHIYGTGGLSFNKSIWFVDWWTGLYEYNYDSLKWIFHNNFPVGLPYSPITAFDVDSTGTFWLGIGNSNLFLYKDTIISKIEIFEEYPPDWSKIPIYNFESTAFAKDGSVWFATTVGLIHWFGKDNYIIYGSGNSNLPGNGIWLAIIDERGYVWNSLFDGNNFSGLAMWNGIEFINYDTDNSVIGSNQIRDIAEDKEGNIWIATWGGGVSKFTYDPTSVDLPQSKQNSLVVFPNPVKIDGELTFYDNASNQLNSFSLWTIEGILVHKYELETLNDQYRIKMIGIASGFYLGIATDSDGNQFTTKIAVVD